MKKIIAICCAALLLAGCAAPTPESSHPETATQVEPSDALVAEGSGLEPELTASVVPDEKKPRCRVERVAGSNIPKRICLSDAEWDEVRNVSQQFYEVISRPMNAPPERRQ